MYRIWIEEVLGFQLRGEELMIAPAIPDEWDGFEIRYRHRSTTYEIAVRRRAGNARVIELDDRQVDTSRIPLVDDGGVHKITVWIPQRSAVLPAPTSSRTTESAGPGVAAEIGRNGQLLPR
jgi:cellobiose phosphorylase